MIEEERKAGLQAGCSTGCRVMLCYGNCSRRVKTNRMFSAFKLTSIQQYPAEFCTSYMKEHCSTVA